MSISTSPSDISLHISTVDLWGDVHHRLSLLVVTIGKVSESVELPLYSSRLYLFIV